MAQLERFAEAGGQASALAFVRIARGGLAFAETARCSSWDRIRSGSLGEQAHRLPRASVEIGEGNVKA